jgi:hypothetical protein
MRGWWAFQGRRERGNFPGFLLLHIHHRNNANVNFVSLSHGAGSAETGEGGV